MTEVKPVDKKTEPTIEELLSNAKILLLNTTAGKWCKGQSTHHTVALHHETRERYHVAEFRHASDATFVDFCHAHLGQIITELEARMTTAPITTQVTNVKTIEVSKNDYA